MTTRPDEHWMQRARREARERGGGRRGRRGLRSWTGWGFLLCAGVAAGYGLWGLYGSGSLLLSLDVTAELERAGLGAPRLGPIRLDPTMNPLRAVLHETHAPVGSSRLQFEVDLEDATGRRLWVRRGSFGSRDDDASAVRTSTSLETFEVERGGAYFVRTLGSGSSMDDLREARLEIRRNVMRIDPRIPWSFGLAALACLIVSLLAGRRETPRDPLTADDLPRAA